MDGDVRSRGRRLLPAGGRGYVDGMVFWITVSALAVAVSAPVVLALVRHRAAARDRADYDIAIYRDQLSGVESDLARGVINDETAERLRTEISRRILDADRRREAARGGEAPRGVTLAAAVLSVAVMVAGSLALYDRIGAPGYGDLPLQARLDTSEEMRRNRPSQATAEAEMAGRTLPGFAEDADPRQLELLEQLRATLEDRPDDPRGLELLARNEAAVGNFVAAYAAQERLIDVKGARAVAEDFAHLAELKVLAAGGYVSPEAESALGAALARDPQNGPARYYTGLVQAQNDRPDRAFAIWRDLLATSAPNAPWVPAVRAQITDVAARAGVRYELPPAPPQGAGPGPTEDDMRAAEALSPEQRMEMVRGMVDGLSTRLATEGGSSEEWARLIIALGVLGDTDRARAIHAEALDVFAGDETALNRIEGAALQSGLTR